MLKLTSTTKLSLILLQFNRYASFFDTLRLQKRLFTTSHRLERKFSSSLKNDSDGKVTIVSTVNNDNSKVKWDDRIGLQSAWSNEEKGWKVSVEWRQTPYGAGLFTLQDVPAGTLLRQGLNGINLIQFHSTREIEAFCNRGSTGSTEYDSKLNYVKDYLWGFNPNADECGYDILNEKNELSPEHKTARFFGMWVPGNGLNHSPNPNTVYRPAQNGFDVGINLVALRSIESGSELFDDYRRHGIAPLWLLKFADKYGVTLNFAECNDFVRGEDGD
jgi:hypothetical protein